MALIGSDGSSSVERIGEKLVAAEVEAVEIQAECLCRVVALVAGAVGGGVSAHGIAIAARARCGRLGVARLVDACRRVGSGERQTAGAGAAITSATRAGGLILDERSCGRTRAREGVPSGRGYGAAR
jgi:hypothetical protein